MKRWIPTLLFFLFICWSITLANSGSKSIFIDIIKQVPYGDKLGHVLLYGVLTAFMITALKLKILLLFNWPVQLGSVLVLTFAFIEEATQLFLINRTFDIYDLYSDVVGVFLFTFVTVKYHFIFKK
jgi:VanZ family protein